MNTAEQYAQHLRHLDIATRCTTDTDEHTATSSAALTLAGYGPDEIGTDLQPADVLAYWLRNDVYDIEHWYNENSRTTATRVMLAGGGPTVWATRHSHDDALVIVIATNGPQTEIAPVHVPAIADYLDTLAELAD